MTVTTTAPAPFARIISLAANLDTDLSPVAHVRTLIEDATAKGGDTDAIAALTAVADRAVNGQVWVPSLYDAVRDLCPACGSKVTRGYAPNPADPGDVDPTAACTRCDWGY